MIKKADLLTSFIFQERERISRYTQEQRQTDLDLKAAKQAMADLKQDLKTIGRFDKKEKEDLQGQISALENRIQNLRSHSDALLTKYRFNSISDIKAAQDTLLQCEQEAIQLEQIIKNSSLTIYNITDHYLTIYDTLPEEKKEEIIETLGEDTIEPEIVYTPALDGHLDDAILSAAIVSVNQVLKISRNTYRKVQTKVHRERRR